MKLRFKIFGGESKSSIYLFAIFYLEINDFFRFDLYILLANHFYVIGVHPILRWMSTVSWLIEKELWITYALWKRYNKLIFILVFCNQQSKIID